MTGFKRETNDIVQDEYDLDIEGLRITLAAKQFKFDPSDTLPTYVGMNKNADATDSDTSWVITKFTYSGSAVTSTKTKTGTWTGRATLLP
jgi:hypothetical protein